MTRRRWFRVLLEPEQTYAPVVRCLDIARKGAVEPIRPFDAHDADSGFLCKRL